MTRPALDYALRTVLNTCALAALLAAPACTVDSKDGDELSADGTGSCGGWSISPWPLDTSGTIVALDQGLMDSTLFLLEDGVFVRQDPYAGESSESLPGTGLRAFVELDNGDRLVVGEGGQILRAPNGSSDWVAIDAGISEDLIDVAAAGNGAWIVAIYATRVLYSSDRGLTWTDLPAPGGSWAGLRRVLQAGGDLWLLADGGQAWMADDPTRPWASVSLGSGDLFAGGSLDCTGCAMILSSNILHIREQGSWVSIPAPEGEAFVAAGARHVATDAGLYLVATSPELRLVHLVDLPDRAVAIVESNTDALLVLDANGELLHAASQTCL